LQSHTYDAVFDLQGNTKSGLIDFFCKAREKVGYGKSSVAEKPNLLFTNKKIDLKASQSIYQFYLSLVQAFFQDTEPFQPKGIKLRISDQEEERLHSVLALKPLQKPLRFMVALGSNWENKRISEATAEKFLALIEKNYEASFLIVYANDIEKAKACHLVERFPSRSVAIGEMSLPFWGALMAEMDGVISMDSAALHLAAAAGIPTFSVFGPSSSAAYKPKGEMHLSMQGSCPYGQSFTKRCPRLRTCKTGACMKDIEAAALFEAFRDWSYSLLIAKVR
jgi:heptosyltransferase-1